MVGIWGFGAEVVFNRHGSKFESCCFLANVGQKSKGADGLIELRGKLIADLVKDVNVYNNRLFLKSGSAV